MLLLLLGTSAISDAAVAPEEEAPFRLSAWSSSLSLRGGVGYKDNVLLSSVRPEGSVYSTTGLDVFLMRLPFDGTEVTLLLTGDHRHYFSVPEADEEATLLVSASAKRTFASGWALGLGGQYFFMNQVLDASIAEPGFSTNAVVLARGHTLSVRPAVTRSLGRSAWLDLECGITRQLFDRQDESSDLVLDDYWEIGPKLALRVAHGQRSEVQLSYALNERPYDERPQADADGADLPGTQLAFAWQRAEATWRQHWDSDRQWRTVTRFGLEVYADNGSGYYDYHKYYVSEQLRFRSGTWEARAQAGLGFYRYALQTVSPTDLSNRERTLVTASARVEKALSSRLTLAAEYEYEKSLSNQDFDTYHVNTVSAGVEWEF